MSTNLLLQKTGLSKRQIDHWARQGYLRTDPGWTGGTGNARRYLDGEDRIAIRMRELIGCGFSPRAAHDLARGNSELMMRVELALSAVRVATLSPKK